MFVPRLSDRPARSALQLLGLLVVVAGLFGMHGLASHGVEGMDVVPGAALTSQAMAASLMPTDLGPVSGDVERIQSSDRSQSMGSSDSGHSDMDTSIAMMCVAILGVALLRLLRLVRGGRSFSVLWARPRQARVMLRAGRGLPPPSLRELSIQRC